jgi:hypothetical protein
MSYQFELALPTIFAAFDGGTNDISQEDFQSRLDKDIMRFSWRMAHLNPPIRQ